MQKHVEKTAKFPPEGQFTTFLEIFKNKKSDKQEVREAKVIVSALLFKIRLGCDAALALYLFPLRAASTAITTAR